MSLGPELVQFVERMPKVELHVHLEGSIQPETLLRLAKRRSVDLPADSVEGLRQWFRFRDFEHFVEIYLACCRCLRDPEDFQLVAEEFIESQGRQNILYTEAHFTVGTHLENGVNGDEVAQALGETLSDAEKRTGVRVRLIPDIVRNVGPRRAEKTLSWALAAHSRGIVVGIGLSGFESESNEPFREHFQVAAREGLHRVAHAGEHAGAESVHSVLEVCGAERIGHGIRVLEDPDLVDRLRDEAIPLEVCPSSNVQLGAVASLAEHPFHDLDEAGLNVTVNSDDPALFDTNLTQEYLLLAETCGYDRAKLSRLAVQSLRAAFVSQSERDALALRFRSQLEELGGRVEPEVR